MTTTTKRLILLIVAVEVVLTIGIFALPRVVQALPGEYYVRLQNNPLTSGLVALVTTPLPTALPVPVAANSGGQPVNLPDIPGLNPAATPFPTPSPQPTVAPTSATLTAAETVVATQPPPPTEPPPPSPTPMPLPDRVVLEGVSSVVQGFNNCGPANLTIVLNYHGDDTTQETAAAYLKPNKEDRNVSPWQISDYVNEFTSLRSTVHSGGDLLMLKRLVAAGFPVVIEKGYEPNSTEGWYGHYLTVYGYDDGTQQIYSKDTNLGPFDGRPRLDDYTDFMYWWQQFNYTFYVVYPVQQESTVFSIIPDELEQPFSMWEYVTRQAQAEQQANPNDEFAWFNYGVAQTYLGQLSGEARYYETAASAFDQARTIGLPPRTLYYEHRPFMAYWKVGRLEDVIQLADALLDTAGGKWVEEVYWFKGHALAAEGRLFEAADAYTTALDVNPNFSPAQQSLDWVNSLISGG